MSINDQLKPVSESCRIANDGVTLLLALKVLLVVYLRFWMQISGDICRFLHNSATCGQRPIYCTVKAKPLH